MSTVRRTATGMWRHAGFSRPSGARRLMQPNARRMESTTTSSPSPAAPQPQPQPQQPPKSSSATSMEAYRNLSRPFAKVFLGAMLAYQLCYFGWEKMRTDDIMAQKTAELQQLESRVLAYHQQGVLPDEEGNTPKSAWSSWWRGWFG